jgi:CRP/FNR family transcriptional regulator, anaerobic regulatory protein
MEKQMCALHEHTFSLGQKNAKEKVATLLLRLLPAWAVPDCPGVNSSGKGVELSLPLSRKQISQYLGLTLETVSRTVTELAKEGFIARQENNRRAILIPDICKLCRFAQGACVSDN